MNEKTDAPSTPFSRRLFLSASAAGAMSALVATSSCQPAPAPAEEASKATTADPTSFELNEVTIAQLQQGLDTGQWTATSLTESYLSRIEALDRQGPELRSVIETNPDALQIATELDKELKSNGRRGPLHGIPILLKDNIDTADKMLTTAGSMALAGARPSRDSFVAARLRAAGAIILGKANLSEWANFRSTRSSSGWSGRGGQCRNPYVLDRNPCGSSSGSGAAVSANLCAVAIGTETDGSIVCPSNANGIVGIKPTVGLVSRSGIIPISHTQDTAGPMCRTVADAALLLGPLTGVDERDPATAASSGKALIDYSGSLDPKGLQGARIGVARSFFGFNPDVDRVMEEALAVLKAQGAELIDPIEIPHTHELDDPEFQVLLYEFKADLNAYLASLGESSPMKTLQDLIKFNEEHAAEEMPYFGQEIFLMAQAKGNLDSAEYKKALAGNLKLSRADGIDAVMDAKRLDAIVAPTGGPAWTTDWLNGDHFSGGSSTPAAVSGYPSVTVPAGFIRALPVGISFFGRAWSEAKLIRLAYSYEQASQARRPPSFLPTLA